MQSVEKMTPKSEAFKLNDFQFEGINEPVVVRYFETMNSGSFMETARLFAPDGELNPPFEEPVVGNEAIGRYLEAEAKSMKLYPQQGIVEKLEAENILKVSVSGRVETPYFGVNINWLFLLNEHQEITSATIKLVASPQELLNLRQFKS
ncbi:nuclear transport factor 2 family protein [Ancylothrix sp. C2]|uniref:nuclear transport factor 2 family protein n=1 Tax=Ancylothrix sp. D3o TaxID=2953691 RepID=UPI0021BB042F|nr:nuclear transport factor 2 family protein [Ancylothrix sp. D3o]MCT7949303.1 nuclear transport factor 2 family protein [Ancylothrix sp. D3o]